MLRCIYMLCIAIVSSDHYYNIGTPCSRRLYGYCGGSSGVSGRGGGEVYMENRTQLSTNIIIILSAAVLLGRVFSTAHTHTRIDEEFRAMRTTDGRGAKK